MRPSERPEIARLPLFVEMGEGQRNLIFAGSFLQVFPPHLTLFEVGDRADFLHILVDGQVELFTSNDGRDTTMAIVHPVRSFILAAVITDMPYLMSARTLGSSRILMVPRELLQQIIRDDVALMQATMRELAMAFRDTVRALTDMKLRQSAERLGNYLLLESARVGRDSFQLRNEKRVMASLLGMTPENLSRAFGALARHGAIIEGAVVRIADRSALIAFSRPDPVVDG